MKLIAIGIKKKGESGFKITKAHLIHTSKRVRSCSNCGVPVSAHENCSTTCPNCFTEFGGASLITVGNKNDHH